MAADHFSRVYARQEYLTPGEPETIEFIADAIGAGRGALVLEVACGKGEAARVLAARTGCRVVAVDRHEPFLDYARRKIAARGLVSAVQLVRADGTRLPTTTARFDVAYCIGAPSIVGLEPCLQELHRAVRPGGVVVVSDIVWRSKPDEPLGPEWGWLARATQRLSADEYRAVIAGCGPEVQAVHLHSRAVWDAYHAPMRSVAADERARGEAAFAEEVERGIEIEQRAVEAFLDYATFVARKPGPATV